MNPMNPFGSNLPAHPHQAAGLAGYQGTMAGASAPKVSVLTDQERMSRLSDLARRYELSGGAVCKLRMLEDYDIVVIADDSGSMTNAAHAVPLDNPYVKVPSRWDELCQRLGDIIDIATTLDKDGIDIYFLNRGKATNITSRDQVAKLFVNGPYGGTPLLKAYQQVLNDKLSNKETKTLILIATDGEPEEKEKFIHLVMSRSEPHRCPISILVCTDNAKEVAWLNELDKSTPCLDVTDDYESEKAEVTQAQRGEVDFKRGDHLVKALLGAIDDTYGNLDKKMLTPEQLASYKGHR